MENERSRFFPLIPGARFPGDWYNGEIPENIVAGENTMVDSASCFKNYHSVLKTGLKVGSFVTFWRTSIAAEENGYIEMGDYCYLANASLVCSKKITIGSRVFIAGGVTIADSDFHPIDPYLRLQDVIALSPVGDRSKRPEIEAIEVIIEDDVWIGMNATILKGVTIGRGAIIEPGSMVIKNVPPGARVSGNPAKTEL
jgi:acetyltransferase-like isoleucine patch superfamily enzyme